ncbi:MAG: DUF2235 domain-containing protein [Gammaproteobacteria bacterium]|nr:DUF2235 domain-containing protein [Gammaproteobacteria bacterium]
MAKSPKEDFLVLGQYTPKVAPVNTVTVKIPSPQLGVFFDGTGNNLFNDNQDSNDDKAPTNIGKLYELYPRDEKLINRQYIEGIGTQAGQADSDYDQAFAYTFGQRIQQAVMRLQRFCNQYRAFKHVKLDVFGFSRGAAAARAFVNEVHYINNTDRAYWNGVRVEVRFLGLFDTVGSIGLPGNNVNDVPIASRGLKGPINLNIHPQAVKQAVHLVAMDEFRDYFPLSSLKQSGGALAGNFIEELWPGAHSDVGGGYGPVPEKIFFPEVIEDKQMPGLRWSDAQLQKRALEIKADYERRYATPGIHIDVVPRRERVRLPMSAEWREVYHFTCFWQRQVDVELAHAPLACMHELACVHRVPLQPLANLSTTQPPYPYAIPAPLTQWVASARAQGAHAPDYANLYQKYIHHSHQFAPKPGSMLNPHAPHKQGNRVARQVFVNSIAEAIVPATTPIAQSA